MWCSRAFVLPTPAQRAGGVLSIASALHVPAVYLVHGLLVCHHFL